MNEYIIKLNGEDADMLKTLAVRKGLSPEQFIAEIVKHYLGLRHNIDQEDMAKGYEEMAAINLELAK